jgi:hypothetical protein
MRKTNFTKIKKKSIFQGHWHSANAATVFLDWKESPFLD